MRQEYITLLEQTLLTEGLEKFIENSKNLGSVANAMFSKKFEDGDDVRKIRKGFIDAMLQSYGNGRPVDYSNSLVNMETWVTGMFDAMVGAYGEEGYVNRKLHIYKNYKAIYENFVFNMEVLTSEENVAPGKVGIGDVEDNKLLRNSFKKRGEQNAESLKYAISPEEREQFNKQIEAMNL